MTALLPQPGSFQGFSACAEDPYAEDSSGLNFVNDEHGAIDWHLADAPVGGDSTANHDFGPCVQKLLRVHVVSRQVSLHRAKVFHGGVRATVNGRPWKLRLIVPLDFGMHFSEQSVEIAAVERLDSGPHDLHVLLRHRPRSIPQAQEPA